MIRTAYYNQEEEPAPVNKDSRGVDIVPGFKVAYNRSGDVKLGEIIKLHRSEWKDEGPNRWRLIFELHVMGENEEISKIKNPNSFVVI